MDVQSSRLVAEGSSQVSQSFSSEPPDNGQRTLIAAAPPRTEERCAFETEKSGHASPLTPPRGRRHAFVLQGLWRYAPVILSPTLCACSGQSVPTPTTPAPEHAGSPTASGAASASSHENEAAGPEKTEATSPSSNFVMPDVNFVPARISDPPNKLPRPWIETPGFDQFVARDWVANYKVMIKVPNWDQVPADSYLQFVFDGRPLGPVTDFKNGIKLQELVGADALTDGEHILAAYVSRPNHESIKGPAGISVHRFWIGKRTPNTFKSNEPMFVLGTPRGEYQGEAAYDILIDWYVLNAVLDKKEFNVHLVLKGPGLPEEGSERYVTEWRPWTVVSAKPGEYTLQADLIDKQGHVAKGTWTSVTRTFKVN